MAVSHEIILQAAEIGIAMETEGHRADISMIKTARTLAALDGRTEVIQADLKKAAIYTLPHRMRKNPLEEGNMKMQVLEEILSSDKVDESEDG